MRTHKIITFDQYRFDDGHKQHMWFFIAVKAFVEAVTLSGWTDTGRMLHQYATDSLNCSQFWILNIFFLLDQLPRFKKNRFSYYLSIDKKRSERTYVTVTRFYSSWTPKVQLCCCRDVCLSVWINVRSDIPNFSVGYGSDNLYSRWLSVESLTNEESEFLFSCP